MSERGERKAMEEATQSHRTMDGAARARRLLALWDGGLAQHDLPDRGCLVLGRGAECDVRIDHASVSRRHALLHVDADGYEIEDLGSANGTRFDERRLGKGERARVEAASRIRLGAVTIMVPPGPSSADAPPATSNDATAPMALLHERVGLVARGKIAVLIVGETGTGKELVARAIHEQSPRANGPFVSLGCAALSETSLERELFGVEAATPGDQAKRGLIEETDGGTLFLDEIGDLSTSTQAKLLRLLESGETTRTGSVRSLRVDVRFVAATNRDPNALVAAGSLRPDLFFRLAGARLDVPPLRERRDEIESLARRFVAAACEALGRSIADITQGAIASLLRHSWPGNVRELKNVVERAVLLSRGAPIRAEHVALDAGTSASAPTIAPPAGAAGNLKAQISALERDRILAALAQCEGNQSRAAKLLGISRRTLITRMEAHQLPRPRKRADDS